MPYNPANPPIREQILSNLVTSLSLIQTPGYTVNIAKVRRWNGDTLDINEFPSIIVAPTGENHDDSRLSLISSVMSVSLYLVLRSSNWQTEINKFLADMRVAITADVTRGGYAVTTRILSDQVYDVSRTTDPVASASVDLEILYRTLYEDPTTAI